MKKFIVTQFDLECKICVYRLDINSTEQGQVTRLAPYNAAGELKETLCKPKKTTKLQLCQIKYTNMFY